MTYTKLSGTFLDEISMDIPSQNWGRREWEREFDTFVEIGLDTVVLIRCGYRDRIAFPSSVIPEYVTTMPVYEDLISMFLDLAGARGISFFMGLYDSQTFWSGYDWQREVEINKKVIAELCDRYGTEPAFAGWYLPHETADSANRVIDINAALAAEAKRLLDRPVLTSPFFLGRRDSGPLAPRGLEAHERIWREIFSAYAGLIDYCAFQDGTTDLEHLREYTRVASELAQESGIELWGNLESFDRDMPIRFPPENWQKLRYKMDSVQGYVSKMITFEFSHFMSPNSGVPGANALYRRYSEFVAEASRA